MKTNYKSFDVLFRKIIGECNFKTSRSSGPGGQHANKVETKVELRFNVLKSHFLYDIQKNKIIDDLKNYINSKHEVILFADSRRSQLANKKNVIDKFYKLLEKALKNKKIRKKTSPNITSIEKRLREKRKQSDKKELRQKTDIE